MKVDWVIIFVVLFCALLGATGQIFFKLASEEFSMSFKGFFLNYKLIIGGALYALSAILFVWSLKFGNVSLLYPLIATSYIWVSIFAHFFLGEPFPLSKLVGIIVIVLGIGIIVK